MVRLATVESPGEQRAVLIIDDLVYDLGQLTGRGTSMSMMAVLENWAAIEPLFDAPNLKNRAVPMALNDVTLAAPIPVPGTIYCAGANYRDHAEEMARKRGAQPPKDPHTTGQWAWHFIKASRTVTASGSVVHLPAASKTVDWEAELAVVIGRKCRNASEADALDYVAGYTVADDLSARDLNHRAMAPADSPFRFDWTSHKSFDGSCPMGPWIVPAKLIGDPQNLAIQLRINGELKQDSNSSRMTFNIAEQIVTLSSSMTLWPGDIILTGTPAGVGAARGEFLRSGDVIDVSIEKIGTITTRIA